MRDLFTVIDDADLRRYGDVGLVLRLGASIRVNVGCQPIDWPFR